MINQEIEEVVESGDFESIYLCLLKHFPQVIVEQRKEPFFFFHFRCGNEEGETQLIVRFGHNTTRNRWIFEIL